VTAEAPLQPERLTLPDDPDQVFAELYARGWTDGLPVIPPTPERVERMISQAGLSAETIVGELPPRNGGATVQLIAVNAVMAGCLPEYMPVLVATVEALADPDFNLHSLQCTTNPVAPLVVLNGPVRHRLQVNCGRNALGPGNRANATIGRAIRLVQLNIGGGIPGEVDKATLGMPGKYTFCLGENEEESPWEPFHVAAGLPSDASAVTVIGAQGTHSLFIAYRRADSILQCLANGMATTTSNNTLVGHGNPIILMNPGHARLLHDQGYTRQRVQEELFERSRMPLDWFPDEIMEVQIEAERTIKDGHAYVCRSADDLLIVVAGGPEPYHITYCPNFGDTRAVTRRISQPAMGQ
jgi:hypothetical protein